MKNSDGGIIFQAYIEHKGISFSYKIGIFIKMKMNMEFGIQNSYHFL